MVGKVLNSVRAINHYLWISQSFLSRISQSCISFYCSFFPAHFTSLAVAMQQVQVFCEMLLFWSSVFSCLFFFFLFYFSCNSFYVCWKTVKKSRIFEVLYWWKHCKKVEIYILIFYVQGCLSKEPVGHITHSCWISVEFQSLNSLQALPNSLCLKDQSYHKNDLLVKPLRWQPRGGS